MEKEESVQKGHQSTKPTLLRGDALKIHVTNRRKIQNEKKGHSKSPINV